MVERQLRLGTVDPASWQRAYAALDRGGRDQAAAWADADPALAQLVAERAWVEQDNQASAAANSFAYEVIATCQGGAVAELRISYLVTGAGWTPLYDLDARDGGKSVTLSTYASVRQSTGEDWRQARLTLTTADPTIHATPPQLIPLDVRAQPRDPPRRQAVSRAEAVPVADQVAPGAAAARAALPASDQGLSVRLAPPAPADVPGDGTTVRILAASLALPGRPLLRAIPRASEAVYRVVELANRAPFPLLPGPMKVFRDGSFAGSQPLGRVVPRGATLAVSLGLEERVAIRRIVLRGDRRDRWPVSRPAPAPVRLPLRAGEPPGRAGHGGAGRSPAGLAAGRHPRGHRSETQPGLDHRSPARVVAAPDAAGPTRQGHRRAGVPHRRAPRLRLIGRREQIFTRPARPPV